jgi:hypothetical protein
MIALHKIEYNGYSNVDFDLIIDCAFDSESGEVSSYLNREAVASESYRGDFRRIHTFKHNEFFTPKFTFIKRDFSDFTSAEYRRLISWLTSKSTTSVLSAYADDKENVSWECFGGWTEIQSYKIANHRTVGVTAVFETTSPWAYSPIKKVAHTITNPTIIEIECNTDDWESFVYPKITIEQPDNIVVNLTQEMAAKIFENKNYIEGTVYHYNDIYYWCELGNDGVLSQHRDTVKPQNWFTTSVSLYNETTGTETYIKGNTANETIILDGANKLITTENNDRSVIGNDFAWNWLPLANKTPENPTNKIRVIGNCTITFEWREPIKIGEF